MSKSRPYIVRLKLRDPADDDLYDIVTRLINGRSRPNAEHHALQRHIPEVVECRPATNVEVAKLMHGGTPFEDATGDPELAETRADVGDLLGGKTDE